MNEADLLLVLGASFSNHTGIYAGPPDHPGRLRPDAARQVPRRSTCPVWGEVGVVVERLRAALPERLATDDQAAQLAERWAIWRAEKASRAADDRGARRQLRVGVRRDGAPDPRRRGDRRRRRQPRLLVRPLLRVQAAHRADVRLPGLDRLRLPGRDGRLGRGARPADRRGHRRRRLRAVHGRAHDRGQARHEHHARAAQQRPARQDQQGAARGRVGRLADLAAQPGLLGLRAQLRRVRRPGHGRARSSTRRSPTPSPTTARRWSRS